MPVRAVFLLALIFSLACGFATARADAPAASASDRTVSVEPTIAPASATPPPAAYQLTLKDTEEVVGEGLAKEGAGERIKAFILGNHTPVLYESDKPLAAQLRSLTFDATAMRWSANLLVTSGSAILSAMPLSGRFQLMAQLPVLKRALRDGEMITADNVEMQDFPASYKRSGVIADRAKMIGQAARSAISPNRPVHENEVGAAEVVKKNALVTMHYRANGMEISATGQAMTNGAAGDTIGVRNITSKTVVRAVVEDAENVSVTPIDDNVAANGGNHAPLL